MIAAQIDDPEKLKRLIEIGDSILIDARIRHSPYFTPDNLRGIRDAQEDYRRQLRAIFSASLAP